MRILAIETSCDDTAISVVEGTGDFSAPIFKILAKTIQSQIELHAKWQGVVPCLAKREHAKNLVPVLAETLKKARLLKQQTRPNFSNEKFIRAGISKILEREPELFAQLSEFIPKNEIPKIDLIAVTSGPGLEPALWTGINLAKALGLTWKIPVMPINHLEGHVLSVLLTERKSKVESKKSKVFEFPTLALLISGGHTELVTAKNWLSYKIIGRTRDDAVGEAFDKVARMLGLPYPGGPEISRLAKLFNTNKLIEVQPQSMKLTLPRPMIDSPDFDFSFSGLKTSVLYKIKELGELSENQKIEFAHEFENSVTDVLVSKSKKALKKFKAKTFIVGGGVSANEKIRKSLAEMVKKDFPAVKFFVPEKDFTTDNATMIAISAYLRNLKKPAKFSPAKIKAIKADGNWSL